MSNPAEHFRLAMAAAGLEPPDTIYGDGKTHRFGPHKNGWYYLHTDGIPWGQAGDWSQQGADALCHWCEKSTTSLTPAERDAMAVQRAATQAQRATDAAATHQQARDLAALLWDRATPATAHPYLSTKCIQPHGARLVDANTARTIAPRLSPELVGMLLVIPMRDTAGALHSLQFITADGTKRPLTGGRKQGCYFQIDTIGGTDPAGVLTGVLVVCEGFATGASIFAATGHSVAVAFDAGNLLAVATALHAQHPALRLVMASDDDHRTDGNPGITKATAAAQAVSGVIVVPTFGADRPDKATDFNDLHQIEGPDAVQLCFEIATAAPDELKRASPAPGVTMADLRTAVQAKPRKPRTAAGPARFKVTDGGVFQFTPATDDAPEKLFYVCAKLEILALIRDHHSGQWGRLLEWHDQDGHRHEWAMPMSALQSDGAEVRRELAAGGLRISTTIKGRTALMDYINNADTPQRARGVDRTGWHAGKDGAMVFVLPDETIGDAGEIVRYQADAANRHYTTAGTLVGWQSEVAALCAGNSRTTLAVSASFAAMLLHFSGLESGGINLRGNSSTGKTTALIAAASVFGAEDYVQRWRSTGNGLEAIAARHNDTLLLLDEMGQVDPKEAGEIAYMLANGQGKQRSNRSGGAQARKGWRLLFLSSGEISLAQHMADGGKKAKAGQEVRMVDLAADPGAGHGLFEVLHGHPDGAALSTAIKAGAKAHHGHAAIEFLQRTTDGMDVDALAQHLKTEINAFVRSRFPGEHPGGQVWRVCERIGFIGVAGEVATANGITGWTAGAALETAGTCFDQWLSERGGAGNGEGGAMLEAVRSFIAKHEESRFTDLDVTDPANPHRITINRAGWRRSDGAGGREYLIDPAIFKAELCQGFDALAVAKELVKAGHLKTTIEADKVRYIDKVRIDGEGRRRVYVVAGSLMEG